MSQQFKILLIEDDLDSLEILRQELLAHDYQVLTAASGHPRNILASACRRAIPRR